MLIVTCGEMGCGGGVAQELLKEFWKVNRKKPERLVFYRDGVSEGQFAEVLQNEFRAVKQVSQRCNTVAKIVTCGVSGER